jgi:hypothetical protein
MHTYFLLVPDRFEFQSNPYFVNSNDSPILIDEDYKENKTALQLWFQVRYRDLRDMTNDFSYMPAYNWQLIMIEAFQPYSSKYSYPYTLPLLDTMKPTDYEDFLNSQGYNCLYIVDFTLYQSSIHSTGYDIDIVQLIDNAKNFNDQASFSEANKTKFVLKAKYMLDFFVPNFFRNSAEHFGKKEFFLRSRVSKHGIRLVQTSMICDMPNLSKQKHLKFTLMNLNDFDVTFQQEAPKKSNNVFPFRFLQWVPDSETKFLIDTATTVQEKQTALGVSLIVNPSIRKNKI